MKLLIFKTTVVVATVSASFAFTTKGPLRIVRCNVTQDKCLLDPFTYKEGNELLFPRATFDLSADGKTNCAAWCDGTVIVASES